MRRVCIAGRPNVGKSTLFNRLYGRRLAITDSMPGVTRDAVAVHTEVAGIPVVLVDTGGIGEGEAQLDQSVRSHSRREMERADLVLVVVDVAGLTGEDQDLLELVRKTGRPAIMVVNKVDNEARSELVAEFWSAGSSRVVSVSAAHGLGMDDLEEAIVAELDGTDAVSGYAGEGPTAPQRAEDGDASHDRGGLGAHTEPADREASELATAGSPPTATRLAIVGRPNSGKSSLLNRLVGEERAIVSDLAGTTRDIVEARFHYRGVDFEVVDTAGLRRRSRVDDGVEFYSVQRANDAIDSAELVVLVIDALNGLSDQDKKIAARLSERGCGIVVALNKWDLLDDRGNQINAIRDRVHFLFPVFQHVPILPISAKTGEGVQPLLNRLLHVRRELYRRVDTGPLNQALQTWLQQTPPPSGKRPVKLRYITQVGTNPVRFLLFVNRRKGFPEFYLRYVRNRIRKDLGFEHIPFFIDLKE